MRCTRHKFSEWSVLKTGLGADCVSWDMLIIQIELHTDDNCFLSFHLVYVERRKFPIRKSPMRSKQQKTSPHWTCERNESECGQWKIGNIFFFFFQFLFQILIRRCLLFQTKNLFFSCFTFYTNNVYMMLHHFHSDIERFCCLYSIPRTHINVNNTLFCFCCPFFILAPITIALMRPISIVCDINENRFQNHYALMYVNPF